MENLDFDNLLKAEVEQVFGQKISDKYACELLSAQIQKEIGENISYQTLRRYLGLVKSENKFSEHTKNVLSRYIGFPNFDSFCTYVRAKSKKEITTNWNIIKDWFSINKEDKPLADSQYWHDKLSQVFAQFILTDETIFDSFCKAMHTNEVAMKYIISYHPMYDNLTRDWYFRGLNLFVRNAKELHYKLFEATLLFMKSVWTCDESNLTTEKNLVEKLLSDVRKKYGTIWVLEARAISCLLYFYKNIDENKYNKLKNECFSMLIRQKNVIFELDNYDIFVFMLSDYCNMWQMHDISAELQEKYELQFVDNALWKNGYSNAAFIVRATTLFFNGEYTKAKKIYEKVSIQNLNFDFKNYFTIQYQLLTLGFCSQKAYLKRQKIKEKIQLLINETGMVYFERLIPKYEI